MSLSDAERELAVALYLQEQDDAILCAFGPDFFDGARKGAGCGGLLTAWLARRSFVNLREDHKVLDATLPQHMCSNSWTIRRGFYTRPFFTLGCVSLALTTFMKCVKLTLANYRYQEFVADDIGFQLLHDVCTEMTEDPVKVKTLLRETLEVQGGTLPPLPNDAALCNTNGVQRKTLTNALMKEAGSFSGRSERIRPSFWDGVAVGLMGSVMDCYLPSRPVYSYYGLRCGMRI